MKIIRFFMKIVICITIIVLLSNCFSAFGLLKNESQADLLADIADFASNPIAGIGKIIFQGIKLAITYMADGIQALLFSLASSGGLNTADTSRQITPFDIFFNRFAIVDVNMFSLETATGDPLPEDSLVYNIRMNTARWYYGFYFIALAALPAILAIVTAFALKDRVMNDTAEQKKVIRDAITSWVVGLFLTLIMHIIIILIINANNLFIELIANIMRSNGFNADISDQMESLHTFSYNDNILISVGSLIVYVMMVLQTFKFLLAYLWRFLRITILIIISPIMPVIYATKDMTNGSTAEVMNTWFKEFIYNVFVQSVDALVYAVLVGVAISSLSSSTVTGTLSDLAPAIMAVAALMFIKKAEDLIKNILGFDKTKSFSKNSIISNVFGGIRNAAVATAGTALGLAGAQKIGTPFGLNIENATAASLAAGAKAQVGNTGAGSIGTRVREMAQDKFGAITGAIENRQNANPTEIEGTGTNVAQLPENVELGEDGQSMVLPPEEVAKLERTVAESNRNKQDLDTDSQETVGENNGNIISSGNSSASIDSKETIEKENTLEQTENNTESNTVIHEPSEEGEPLIVADADKEETLNEFKDKFSQLQEDSDIIRDWGDEIDNQLDEIEGLKENLQSGEDRLIDDDIDAKIKEYLETSPELREKSSYLLDQIKAYINEKYKDDPTKREYADKYLNYKAFSDLDDENMQSKAKLIAEYRKKGLKIDDVSAATLMTGTSETVNGVLGRMSTTAAIQTKAPKIAPQDIGGSSTGAQPDNPIVETTTETETITAPDTEVSRDLSSTEVFKEAIKQAAQSSQQYKEEVTKALNVERAFEGKANIESELTEEDYKDLATYVEKNLANPRVNYKNHIKGYNDAKRKVEAEGKNAMKQCEEFMNNPTPERAAGMSEAQRDFVKIANLVNEKGLFANYELDGKDYGSNSSAVISSLESMKTKRNRGANTETSSNVIELYPKDNNSRKAG